MSLSSAEQTILADAATSPSATTRRQAVTIYLSKSGTDKDTAAALLAESFAAIMQPSFHLIPRGDAMASESAFTSAYHRLATATRDFTAVNADTLRRCLTTHPETLAPLRMILGFTHNELAVAMKLVDPASTTAGGWLRAFERSPAPANPTAARTTAIGRVVDAVLAVMAGDILTVPTDAAGSFHSKLDKRDTRDGWDSVAGDAGGVPYSALLYQRYVGGVWRQVQDAYSEVKGDALLEVPLADLLTDEEVPFYQSPRGASGASRTAQRYDLSPGPDFLIPEESPTVVIESKVGEDGGTVRDKASRIKNLATTAHQRGLVACAVIDGKGWTERPGALIDVVVATEGRTYSLQTLSHILEVPEINGLRGTA